MGFLRGTLVFVLSFILFLAFLFGGAFWTFSKSLEYEVVQPQITNLSLEISQKMGLEKLPIDDPKFAEDVYYKNYGCNFIKCLKEDREYLILVSEKSRNYWRNLFKWSIILSVIVFALLFLVVKPKNSALVISGILMMGASLIYKEISWISSLIPNEFLAKFFQ
ncbi:MAG: hypothetical protein D6785_03935, partial [Planctomycetota bacterium]